MATFTEIAEKIVKLFAATDKYHDIVNGPNDATVVVTSGTLPTFAKTIKDFTDTSLDRVVDLETTIAAATNSATPETLVKRDTNGGAMFKSSTIGGMAIYVSSTSGMAIYASSTSGMAIYASSTSGTGVSGTSGFGTGVSGTSGFGNHADFGNGLVTISNSGTLTVSPGSWTGSTFSGAQAFSSTARPTSAGTGNPASNSLITRADGDARYASYANVNVKIQTSNLDIVSRDTLGDSAALVVPVATNTNYQIEIFLPYWCLDGTVTQGLKVALSGPGGWSFEGSIDIAASNNWRQAGRRFTQSSIFGEALGNPSGEASFRIMGSAFVGATAGNIAVQLAQETSSANRTRVLKGAYLKATRTEAII